MVEPDFTPLPVYEAMQNFELPRVLHPGVHQADHWAINLGTYERVAMDSAEFGEALALTSATFYATGTQVTIRWRGERLRINSDNEQEHHYAEYNVTGTPDAWIETTIPNPNADPMIVGLQADTPFLLDSVTVSDRTIPQLTPIVGTLIALLITGIGAMVGVLWRRT